MSLTRRSMIGGLSALAAGSAVSITEKVSSTKLPTIPKGSTILFQGDSITDAGRNKGAYYPNQAQGMGQGYVRHIVTELMGQHAESDLKFYNRGISGHKVFQLRDRWEDDCMMLKPDVLSVMIGVNDFWHTLDFNYDGTAKIYESDFNDLMERTLKGLPDVKLIIAEPFVLHEGTAIKAKVDLWKGTFESYQAASRRVADRFGAAFVPFQSIFDEALKSAPTSYWCPDGVHPSMAGNALMADAWLKTFNDMMS